MALRGSTGRGAPRRCYTPKSNRSIAPMATDSRSGELLRQRGIWAIFLIGFMGAGKTTVGTAAAKRIGWRFVDLDDEVEAAAGVSVAEIFRRSGEAEFRRMEIEAIHRLTGQAAGREGAVIALGGGAFAQPEVRQALRSTGQPVVLLDAAVNELIARCRKSAVERPLAQSEQRFRQLYSERQASYAEADLRVSTSRRSAGTVVRALLQAVSEFSGRAVDGKGAAK